MPLEYIEAFREDLHKILIPYHAIPALQRTLAALDLTEEAIYFGADQREEAAGTIAAAAKEAMADVLAGTAP